jgi:hypothetical protein
MTGSSTSRRSAAAFSTQWDQQPFWTRCARRAKSTNLRPLACDQENIGNAILRVARAGSAARPASVDGIALVQLRGVMRDATVDYAAATAETRRPRARDAGQCCWSQAARAGRGSIRRA